MKQMMRINPNPMQKLQLCRRIKKRHKAYIVVAAVVVVATVIAVSLVLTQSHYADGSDTAPVVVSPTRLRPLLLFTGDSITEQGTDPTTDGWVTLLQSEYTRSADMVVRGLGGYNTRWFLKYGMPVIQNEIRDQAYTPTVVTVWFGANDAALPNGSNVERHVPLALYTENLVQIVNKFQESVPALSILLITPPHIDDAVRQSYADQRSDNKRGLLDRSNTMAGSYAHACVEAANRLGVPVLDLYTFFNAMSASTRNALLADGLHFNAQGNKLVRDQIRAKIKSDFPNTAAALKTWEISPSSKWVDEDPWVPDTKE